MILCSHVSSVERQGSHSLDTAVGGSNMKSRLAVLKKFKIVVKYLYNGIE